MYFENKSLIVGEDIERERERERVEVKGEWEIQKRDPKSAGLTQLKERECIVWNLVL